MYDAALLREAVEPFSLHLFAQLPSTNDHAVGLIASGEEAPPFIILAEQQSAGRGQRNNRWWSTAGSLTASFAISARNDLAPGLVPILAGVFVREAIAELTRNPQVALKWPNDVLFNGRKLAGILCERRREVDVVGVGINVCIAPGEIPPELRERATCLSELTSTPIKLDDAVVELARRMRRLTEQWQPQTMANLLDKYDRNHLLRDCIVDVEVDGGDLVRGVCGGIDSVGRLVVRAGSTKHRITGGSVRIIG